MNKKLNAILWQRKAFKCRPGCLAVHAEEPVLRERPQVEWRRGLAAQVHWEAGVWEPHSAVQGSDHLSHPSLSTEKPFQTFPSKFRVFLL